MTTETTPADVIHTDSGFKATTADGILYLIEKYAEKVSLKMPTRHGTLHCWVTTEEAVEVISSDDYVEGMLAANCCENATCVFIGPSVADIVNKNLKLHADSV